jgi:hypothetical protein
VNDIPPLTPEEFVALNFMLEGTIDEEPPRCWARRTLPSKARAEERKKRLAAKPMPNDGAALLEQSTDSPIAE